MLVVPRARDPCSYLSQVRASCSQETILGKLYGSRKERLMTSHQQSSSFIPGHINMVKFAKSPPKQSLDEDEVVESAMATDSEADVRNGKEKADSDRGEMEGLKKRKRKSKSKAENGAKHNGPDLKKKRRLSVSKPARDPRDEASPGTSEPDVVGTRSPSPVIDFDGLSKPSKSLGSQLISQFLTLSRQGNTRTPRGKPRAGIGATKEDCRRGANNSRGRRRGSR